MTRQRNRKEKLLDKFHDQKPDLNDNQICVKLSQERWRVMVARGLKRQIQVSVMKECGYKSHLISVIFSLIENVLFILLARKTISLVTRQHHKMDLSIIVASKQQLTTVSSSPKLRDKKSNSRKQEYL